VALEGQRGEFGRVEELRLGGVVGGKQDALEAREAVPDDQQRGRVIPAFLVDHVDQLRIVSAQPRLLLELAARGLGRALPVLHESARKRPLSGSRLATAQHEQNAPGRVCDDGRRRRDRVLVDEAVFGRAVEPLTPGVRSHLQPLSAEGAVPFASFHQQRPFTEG